MKNSPHVVLGVAHTQVVDPRGHDDYQGQHLGHREEVLHLGGPRHVRAVQPRQENCMAENKSKPLFGIKLIIDVNII